MHPCAAPPGGAAAPAACAPAFRRLRTRPASGPHGRWIADRDGSSRHL